MPTTSSTSTTTRSCGQEEHEGHVVYVIESIPHEDAAVVWGKEVLRVRDDESCCRRSTTTRTASW